MQKTSKRKVIKHGPSTLIVSIPAKWAKTHRIKAGMQILATEMGRQLLLSPTQISSELCLSIDVSDLAPRLVDRFLARAYQAGYDQLEITYGREELLEVIQRKTTELLGYEVVEQNSSSCTVRSVTEDTDIRFEAAQRRTFRIVQDMIDELADAYKENDSKRLDDLRLKDFELNKMAYYCLRQLSKQRPLSHQQIHQSHIIYYQIEILEDLGDHIKRIGQIISEHGPLHEQISQCIRDLQDLFRISYSYLYEPDEKKANEAYERFSKAQERCEQLTLPDGELQTVRILLWSCLSITYHFTSMRLDSLAEESQAVYGDDS